MDETPMYFDIAADHTYDVVGSKDVLATTTGHEKLRFTVVLTVTASGRKLKPMIIFKNLQKVPQLKSGQSWPKGKLAVSFISLLIRHPL